MRVGTLSDAGDERGHLCENSPSIGLLYNRKKIQFPTSCVIITLLYCTVLYCTVHTRNRGACQSTNQITMIRTVN
jgi:hypothetical protein